MKSLSKFKLLLALSFFLLPSLLFASAKVLTPIPAQPDYLTAQAIAGKGPTGDLIPLSVDALGNLSISVTPAALGQATMQNSSPVVISSDQSAVPASQSGTWNVTNVSGTISLPTGAATSANQTTANTSLLSIDGKLTSPLTIGLPALAATSTKQSDGSQKSQIVDSLGNVAGISTAGADGVSNTANRLEASSWIKAFNGTTWDRVRSGQVSVSSTFTGFVNTLGWAIYHVSPSTRTDGQGGALESTTIGALQTNDAALITAIGQPTKSSAVTPSDSTDLTATCTKGVAVDVVAGSSTTIAFKLTGDSSAVTRILSGSAFLPGSFLRVMSTGTTLNSASVTCYGG